jgi:hypothetical protein
MTATPAILALVATIALGIAVGLIYLQRGRKKALVTAHLVAGLAATALVAVLVALTPAGRGAGPHAAVPLMMLGISLAAGWSALRYMRGRRASEMMLAGHAVIGVAAFLVFLAWLRNV